VNLLGTLVGEKYRLVSETDVALFLAQYLCDPSSQVADQLARGQAVLDRLLTAGLPYRNGPHGRELDPYEAFNFSKVTGEAWRSGMVSRFRHLVAKYEEPLDRRRDGLEVQARCIMRHRRRWFFHDKAIGSPVRLAFVLPIDDPLRKTVSVEVIANGGARVAVHPGAVELRTKVPPEQSFESEIRLETTIDCEVAQRGRGVASPNVLATWLAPDEPSIPARDRVESIARDWAGSHEAPIDRLRALWNGLSERLRFGFVHPEDTVVDPFELGWSDCRGASALFVAMSRAMGIPARLVCGFMLYEPPSDMHFWMEAWLADAGWVPFDIAASAALAEGEDGAAWSTYFFGRLDYRLISARFPRRAFAPTGAALPPSWYRVERNGVEGHCIDYYRQVDRRPVFTDVFKLEPLTWT
jgi:transglutaminase-like putative cysteine protease